LSTEFQGGRLRGGKVNQGGVKCKVHHALHMPAQRYYFFGKIDEGMGENYRKFNRLCVKVFGSPGVRKQKSTIRDAKKTKPVKKNQMGIKIN